MTTTEDDELIGLIVAFAERAKAQRHPGDLRRLADVYRACIGAAVDWGTQNRRCIGVRVTEAVLPDLKAARRGSSRRVYFQRLLAGLLASECDERAFRGIAWDATDASAVERWEAVHVFGHLAARVGAFGGEHRRDVDTQVDLTKKALNRARLNARRRARKTKDAKG